MTKILKHLSIWRILSKTLKSLGGVQMGSFGDILNRDHLPLRANIFKMTEIYMWHVLAHGIKFFILYTSYGIVPKIMGGFGGVILET